MEMERSVESRVADLERKNRRLALLCWISPVLLGAALLLGQAAPEEQPRVLEAERLLIKDKEGRERITMGRLAGGSPGIAISDKNGKQRLVLSLSELLGVEGVHLNFRDENGVRRLALVLGPTGPAVILRDGSKKSLACLGAGGIPEELKDLFPALPDVQDRGFLQLYDAEGKEVPQGR